MAREFNRSMFVMLLSIMIGVSIITYFVADIKARNEERIEATSQIENLEQKNINFTNYFIRSSVILDKAREDRALGNYYFDLALLWYQSALSEKNQTNMELYKTRAIENSTNSGPNFINSQLNFEEAENFFIDTKSLTDYPDYITVLDLYIDLTESGSTLAKLRYNASFYLIYLAENLTFSEEDNNVTYLGNMTFILMIFEEIMMQCEEAEQQYEKKQEEIDEYEFFDEVR